VLIRKSECVREATRYSRALGVFSGAFTIEIGRKLTPGASPELGSFRNGVPAGFGSAFGSQAGSGAGGSVGGAGSGVGAGSGSGSGSSSIGHGSSRWSFFRLITERWNSRWQAVS